MIKSNHLFKVGFPLVTLTGYQYPRLMSKVTWQHQFYAEIEKAKSARANGNEGMARVCARRAAGVVVGEYLVRQGTLPPSESAYDSIKYFNELPDLPPGVREVSGHFLVRINVDHRLPSEIDLISDAEWLESVLLD